MLCWIIGEGSLNTAQRVKHVEEAGGGADVAQGDNGGVRWSGQVCAHVAVHVRRVRRRLRAYQGRQLQEEGGAGWRGGSDRHSGHGGSGGLRCHPRQLLPLGRGLPVRLLHHGARELRRDAGVSRANSAREERRQHPFPAGRQQVGPRRQAPGAARRLPGARRRVARALRRDLGQDARQRRQGVLRPDAGDPVAQVGRRPRHQRRRARQEAQENQVRHLVGAATATALRPSRRPAPESLSCLSLALTVTSAGRPDERRTRRIAFFRFGTSRRPSSPDGEDDLLEWARPVPEIIYCSGAGAPCRRRLPYPDPRHVGSQDGARRGGRRRRGETVLRRRLTPRPSRRAGGSEPRGVGE
ncbi:unnamed protein product [Pieris brassicae]|uniref:Uncharacterized protein n=1 Tax=Pieris brassicae TaxID=7116 RepID=A0A9P0TIZ2_PIEBR|nr:unnamed protein product [Pieris brassicae]